MYADKVWGVWQASLGDRFEELEKIVSSIDAREAEATVELDHDNIFAAIKLLPDGFDGLNKEMRLAQQKWLADAAEGGPKPLARDHKALTLGVWELPA